jgi:hypothetical protein
MQLPALLLHAAACGGSQIQVQESTASQRHIAAKDYTLAKQGVEVQVLTPLDGPVTYTKAHQNVCMGP